MLPLISVIVPVYNMELYLDKCILSIMKQTYRNIEIILVDDGSTDNSLQVCLKYAAIDNRIKVIHKENGGLSSARNAGLEICNGRYIGFVDSDDWIAEKMYETLLSMCKSKDTISTIGITEVTQDGLSVNSMCYPDQVLSAEDFLRGILCHRDNCSVCSRLFPREVIAENRFDESKLNEDILFLVSIINNVEYISYSSSMGYYYLSREGSISRHFGKAVHDMVGNAVCIRRHVEKYYPSLAMEAEYFEIFQHMSFLFCCPSDYDRLHDAIYRDVLVYVRKNLVKGIRNSFFSRKERIKLVGIAFFPRLMSKMLEIKTTTHKRI